MLSKMFLRGTQVLVQKGAQQSRVLVATSQRGFRSDFNNPYLHDPTPITEYEAKAQLEKPVWERTFDYKKYMEHDGPLKLSTGIAFLDVEPYPRMKLMKLYYLTLEEMKELPDKYGYKFLSQELTRFRMKVVDENKSIRAIEEKIAFGLIEELIVQAHNELKLLRIMKKWKPWEELYYEDEDEEMMQQMLHFTVDNPFPTPFEKFDNLRNNRPIRRATAAVHPSGKE